MNRPSKVFYEFHEFRIDPEKRLLLRNEKPEAISPKMFDTLLLLVRNHSRVVTEEELRKEVWHGLIRTKNNINVHIWKIRKALGQSGGHRCIETVEKQGYRFACEVREISDEAADTDPEQQAARLLSAEPVATPELQTLSDWAASAGAAGSQTAAAQAEAVSVSPLSKVGRLVEAMIQYKLIIPATLLLLLGAAFMAISGWDAYIHRPGPKPEPPLTLANPRKLTNDGRAKPGCLVTDGSRLYFSEVIDGNRVPFQMVSSGGELSEIPVPFASIALLDISPDQTELLIGSHFTDEPETLLWVMSVLGGSPRSLGNLRAHSAAWAPDGKHIAFASGSRLYVADRDGAEPLELIEVPGSLSYNLRWSPDGSRIRFDVRDPRVRSRALWEVNADGTNLHPLLPEWNKPADECCGTWTPDGKYFLFEATRDHRTTIWAIRERGAANGEAGYEPIQLIEGAPGYRSPVVSKDGKTLFVISEMNRGELVRYDKRTQQWVRYLGGISAEQVKFSGDGQWIVYVTYPEGELWKSKVDGSNRQQLSFSPLRVFNACWSPDDRRIAFSAMETGKSWQVYLISAEGGKPQPITPEGEDERVINWTADGNGLILSKGEKVLGQRATVRFDLKTGTTSEIADVRGVDTPRWSPKGDYLSALRSKDGKGLLLYDMKNKVWKDLVSMNVGYRVWSQDGKYIYFRSIYRHDPAIFRVRIVDGKTERWATLKELQQAPGAYGPWMGLSPDGSVLMLRDTGIQNIYAFDLQSP